MKCPTLSTRRGAEKVFPTFFNFKLQIVRSEIFFILFFLKTNQADARGDVELGILNINQLSKLVLPAFHIVIIIVRRTRYAQPKFNRLTQVDKHGRKGGEKNCIRGLKNALYLQACHGIYICKIKTRARHAHSTSCYTFRQ